MIFYGLKVSPVLYREVAEATALLGMLHLVIFVYSILKWFIILDS